MKREVKKEPHILEGELVAPLSVTTEPSEKKESIILMLEDRNRALLYELQELRRQLSLAPVPVKEKGAVTYYLIWPIKFIQLLYISRREAGFPPSSGEEGGQGRSCPDDQS